MEQGKYKIVHYWPDFFIGYLPAISVSRAPKCSFNINGRRSSLSKIKKIWNVIHILYIFKRKREGKNNGNLFFN